MCFEACLNSPHRRVTHLGGFVTSQTFGNSILTLDRVVYLIDFLIVKLRKLRKLSTLARLVLE